MLHFHTFHIFIGTVVAHAAVTAPRHSLGRLTIPKCPMTDDGFQQQSAALVDASSDAVAVQEHNSSHHSSKPGSVASRLARRQQRRFKRAKKRSRKSRISDRQALRRHQQDELEQRRQEAEEERALREMRNQAVADSAFRKGEWQDLNEYGTANSTSASEVAEVDTADEDEEDELEGDSESEGSWWPFSVPGNSSNIPDMSDNDAYARSPTEASAPRTMTTTTTRTKTTTTITSTMPITTASPTMAVAPVIEEPRVYFLFLVQSGLDHPELWRSFLLGADSSKYRAFVHCKSPDACKASGILTLIPGMKMVETVPTYYCHDLVTAMVHTLDGALREGGGMGGSSRDKFVFVSESALPVKPFTEVHSALTTNHDSDLCIFPKSHWATAHVGNTRAYLVKHHQWVTLNRAHAEVMVRDWAAVDEGGHWSVPLDSPGWSGEYNASTFEREPIANWCTDEWAFFATIYGAIPDDGYDKSISLRDMGAGSIDFDGPASASMQGVCRTFAFFNEDGHDFAAVARDIVMDHGSKLSCWPTCQARPTTFLELSDASLIALRSSPFLFARKFDKGAFDKRSYERYVFDMQESSKSSNETWPSWPFLVSGGKAADENRMSVTTQAVGRETPAKSIVERRDAIKVLAKGFLHKQDKFAQQDADDDEDEDDDDDEDVDDAEDEDEDAVRQEDDRQKKETEDHSKVDTIGGGAMLKADVHSHSVEGDSDDEPSGAGVDGDGQDAVDEAM